MYYLWYRCMVVPVIPSNGEVNPYYVANYLGLFNILTVFLSL